MPCDVPGDFNHDGTVDAADYVLWRKNPGGIYTQNDYNVWRAHFGQTAGGAALTAGGPLSAHAPEPSSITLSAMMAVWITMRSRHPCRRTIRQHREVPQT